MKLIDWHSHILPNIDDGSRDVGESVKLLEILAEQGIDTVIATPHFIANNLSVSEFIEERNGAYNKLMAEMPNGLPKIVLGAEVEYYLGISRLAELKSLCVEKSRLLLLEMPISHPKQWKDLFKVVF